MAMASGNQSVVKAEAMRLRAEPNLASPILALVTEETTNAGLSENATGWEAILFRNQQDFMSSYQNDTNASANPLLAYVNTSGSVLNIRSGPGTAYSIVDQVPSGTVLPVISSGDGWHKVEYKSSTAYVSEEYARLMTLKEYETYKGSSDALGNQIVQCAQNYIGCKYVFGANGPTSFDCSGFVKYIYSQYGYSLNRTATDQLENGVAVEKDALQPGDLVFFRSSGTEKPVSHVGMYIGDGNFIHASTNEYQVRIDNLDSGYYANIYVYARHVL
jgi:cell wall-associated NlpC family hydrolase